MKTNAKPLGITPGDIQYSKLSHTLKFTVSINERIIMILEDATGNNMLSPEEAALALCRLAETAVLAIHTPDNHSDTCDFDETKS